MTTTKVILIKRWCRVKGIFCEYATEHGWCKVTACVYRNYFREGDTE